MDKKKEILKNTDVFNRLEEGGVRQIDSIMEKRRTHAGEKLAEKGETAAFFFILVSGTFMLSMADGRAVVFKEPGDFIAMELLSRQGKYISTIQALTDGKVYVVSRERFLEIIQEDSPAAGTIMKSWKSYLERVAPFVKKFDVTDNEERF